MKILILSSDNTIRSQMAEAILKSFDKELEVYSAGIKKADEIHPKTIQVLKEIGIDIEPKKPVNAEKYLNEDFDYLITVFQDTNEIIPSFKGKIRNRIHLDFDDPSYFHGSEEEVTTIFRKLRDSMKNDLRNFYYEIGRERKNK